MVPFVSFLKKWRSRSKFAFTGIQNEIADTSKERAAIYGSAHVRNQGRSRRVIRRRAVEPSLSCFKKGNKASRDDCYEEQNEPLYYTSIDTTSVKRTPEHKSKSEGLSWFLLLALLLFGNRCERSAQQNHPLKESCGLANS
ncbi:hypothetical protein Tco_0679690 [Tanacetum coccineum]|uniref:Uncharacterized protein n=1 Tax=Tanacetum coccineum TaxID=301880 RepID=A0ABQ4XIM5_9ASTR